MDGIGEVYWRALDELARLAPVRVGPATAQGGYRGFDARLKIQTDGAKRELLVQQYRSHLGHKSVDHIIAAAAKSPTSVLILAPHIGAGLAAKLVPAGLNYLDARGNCHISSPPLYIHIEGRRGAPVRPADKGLRSAGYQVLFAYLAEPALLDRPRREVAEAAGVSRQPVADMNRRLRDQGYVVESKTGPRWHPRRRQDALSLWLHGYETAVRPSLLHGTYRTDDSDPATLEVRLAEVFAQAGISKLRWGGAAAGVRLTGHDRGPRTVVHADTSPADLPLRLRAVADASGNLVVMRAFGQINGSLGADTVHPLLAYSELLSEDSEPARKAARVLYDQHLMPLWGES